MSVLRKVEKKPLENLDTLGSIIFGKGSKEAIDLAPSPTTWHLNPFAAGQLSNVARRRIESIKEKYNKEYEESRK